jgi:ferric-dicitrate binding protein FerR (iron transport regulator)
MTDHHEQLILKFLHGKISSDEREALNKWLVESVENKKLANDLELLWKSAKAKEPSDDFQTQEEWNKLESAVNITSAPRQKEVDLSRRVEWLKIAASITLISVFAWLLYLIVFSNETILKESHESIVQFSLPDGSKVWLNHHSRLAYQEDFNEADRIVKISGEAFFEVKKDVSKPFVVQTAHAQVKVLGTAFNVQAYANASTTEVFVATGLVSFSSLKNKASDIKLKPGETGTLIKNESITVLHTEENPNALAWKEKRLIFKRASLNTVIENLESYFKIDIQVDNKNILHCRFTGSYNQPTLEEIIEALSVSLNLTISKQDNAYLIDGEGC